MIINHNISAMNAQRNMTNNTNRAGRAMEKLSSGLRINRAGDDAAGLAISEKMRGQIRGLNQASRNAQDGISMIQTAEGGLNESHSILQRMRELSVQASNGTVTETDRASLQDELNQLTSEINRIGNTTEFNAQKVLNGGMDSKGSTKITQAGSAEKVLGGKIGGLSVSEKTLGAAATTATTTASKAAKTADITLKDAAADVKIAKDSTIKIDGVVFTANAEYTITANKSIDDDNVKTQADVDKIKELFVNAEGKTLDTVANLEVTGKNKFTIESKTVGASSGVEVEKDEGLTNDESVTAAKGGDGVAVKVGDKVFELAGISIDVTDDSKKKATIEALGKVTSTDGTKLSELVNIELDSDDKLKFSTKPTDGDPKLSFVGSDGDPALGFVTTDAGDVNVTKAPAGASGKIGDVKVKVDNTTFNLKGIEVDPTDTENIVEKLSNATSGGKKLGELVDIKVEEGKLKFTTKSTGKDSTIQFTGTSDILGIVAEDATEVKGTNTTVEKAGLQAANGLDTTKDITIGKDSTFKVFVGSESAVTVNLNRTNNPKVYDTNNVDANVSKAAMEDLIKDVNAALQESGLSGKVSASLSQDNKVQFISESGVDIKLEDAANSPLEKALGHDKASMETVTNVEQVAGPGAQGVGYNTTLQIGANTGQSISLQINDMRAGALGITGNAGQDGFTTANGVTNGTNDIKAEAALNILDKNDATKSITVIDKAIQNVSSERSKLGAVQNRLEHTINNLGASSENLSAAESRIRDVDMADEMLNFSKENILQQAAQAMLAQAKQAPQAVLQLLR